MAIAEATTVETTGTQAQQTRSEFMVACLADGTTREVCEARWTAAHEVSPEVEPQTPPPADRAGLFRENEMLRTRLEVRERQLRQAVDIANRANEQSKAKDSAQKSMLVGSIQIDSQFSKDELDKKSLSELQTIRLTLDKSMAKTFASVAAEIDAESRRQKPHLTVGAWDSQKKQWVGGT